MSHIFESGQFIGLSLEQVYLKRYAELKIFIKWARKQPNLSKIVGEFDNLEDIIKNKKLVVKCHRCGDSAEFLSLIYSSKGNLVPDPYFWCEKHEPREEDAFKLKISFKLAEKFPNKTDQGHFCKILCRVLGMKRVTKKSAHDFFMVNYSF